MEIGNRIKEARKEKGLTQKALAEKRDISTITIQNYENSRRKPNIEMIKKIAEVLGVSQYKLMTGKSIFDGVGGIQESFKQVINFGIEQSTDCRMDKILILKQYIRRLAEDKNIELSNNELSEIVKFLSPVIDPLLEHKLNEILERHKKEK